MKNPVPHSKMFATPDSEEDLFERLNQYTGPERAVAFLVAMQTMNLCHKLAQKEIDRLNDLLIRV